MRRRIRLPDTEVKIVIMRRDNVRVRYVVSMRDVMRVRDIMCMGDIVRVIDVMSVINVVRVRHVVSVINIVCVIDVMSVRHPVGVRRRSDRDRTVSRDTCIQRRCVSRDVDTVGSESSRGVTGREQVSTVGPLRQAGKQGVNVDVRS